MPVAGSLLCAHCTPQGPHPSLGSRTLQPSGSLSFAANLDGGRDRGSSPSRGAHVAAAEAALQRRQMGLDRASIAHASSMTRDRGGHVTAMAYSLPDGAALAAASSDGYVRIYDPQTGRRLGEFFAGAAAQNSVFDGAAA